MNINIGKTLDHEAHNLKVAGSNPAPATRVWARYRGLEKKVEFYISALFPKNN